MNNSTTSKSFPENLCKTDIDKGILIGTHILLVEDNVINQEVAKAMLHQRDMSVDVAENGKQAVEMVSKKEYDCVLMDLQMPVMDGHTATRIIREELHLNTLPILAMTAKVLDIDVKNALDAGMNCHIPKPINLNLLLSEMAYWITNSREQQSYLDEDTSGKLGQKMQDCLEKVGGSITLFLKILNVFLEKHTNAYEQVSKLLVEGKRIEARKIVHSLKGVASVVGANDLHNATVELEAQLLADSDDLALSMENVKMYLAEAVSDIKKYISQNKAQGSDKRF